MQQPSRQSSAGHRRLGSVGKSVPVPAASAGIPGILHRGVIPVSAETEESVTVSTNPGLAQRKYSILLWDELPGNLPSQG